MAQRFWKGRDPIGARVTYGAPADPQVIMGDFNVAPTDADVWDIGAFADSTHVTDVTPESGYTGGGVPETSASESAEATGAELETGVESGFVTTEEPVSQ